MAKLGLFSRSKDNTLTGTIRTLTFSAALFFEPIPGPAGDLAPSHRIVAGEIEVGAAWVKQGPDGRIYYNVKIDDPSFSAPLHGTLAETDRKSSYALIWNRPGSARHSRAA